MCPSVTLWYTGVATSLPGVGEKRVSGTLDGLVELDPLAPTALVGFLGVPPLRHSLLSGLGRSEVTQVG